MGFIKKLTYIVAVLAIIFVAGLCLGFFGSNYISDNLLTDPEAASGNAENETANEEITESGASEDAMLTNEPVESATQTNEPVEDTTSTNEQEDAAQTTEQTNGTVQATETVQAMDLLSRDAIPAKGLENEQIPAEMQEIDEEQEEEQEIENKPTIVPKPESDAVIENAGPLTVCGNKENLEVNGEFVFMPVRRVFEPAEFDTAVGSGIRLRNTDTKSKSKLLIHSPEGYFKDYQLNPNHDMFIVFNEAGTYEFELYSFENSKDTDGDGNYEELVAFGYYGEVTVENINGNPVTKEEYVELPSVLTVTVDDY